MSESSKPAQASIGGLAVRHPATIDGAVRNLLESTNVCVISTLGDNGQIHTRTVWVDTDGEHVVVNSVADRVWVRDLTQRPRVTCTVVNLSNPYEFVSIEGSVAECTRDGADAHIDFLAHKYLGVDRYPFHDPSQPRLKILVSADRILHMAPEDAALG